ncbi:MAG: D-amino acid aminotransferase, partial [Candidatus Sedimenticola endophacoides]
VLELAAAGGLTYREAPISEQQLRTADEVWITSSTREIVPVTRLDGVAVGDGVPGPVFGRMRQLYADYKRGLQQGRGSG